MMNKTMKTAICQAALLAAAAAFASHDAERDALADEITAHVRGRMSFVASARAKAKPVEPIGVRVERWQEVWPKTQADIGLLESASLVTNTVDGEIWSDAIEAALARWGSVRLPAREKPYYIDRPVALSSGQSISAVGAEIRLKPGTGLCMLRNKSVVGMVDQRSLAIPDVPYDRDILVDGGTWFGMKTAQTALNGNASGDCAKKGNVHGCYGAFVFNHVNGLALENVVVGGCQTHALQLSDVHGFHVRNIEMRAPARDGVHVHGGCDWGWVDGVAGETYDDFVALNAWDWANTSPVVGPIHHVVVENVVGGAEGTRDIRLLPGNRKRTDGSGTTLACEVRDIVLRHLTDVHELKAYDQPNLEMGRDKDRSEPIGTMSRIYIDDMRLSRPCRVEIDDNVDGFHVSRVKYAYRPPADDKLVVIGPKSEYWKKTIQIFSPDEDIVVRDFSLRDVTGPDGRPIDPADCIRISRDGKGKVTLEETGADGEGKRPWGVAPDGSVWTGHSKRFINAPALKFADVSGAAAYIGEVIDDFHRTFAVTGATSVVSLEPVWKDLPVGYVTVICRGVNSSGVAIGEAGRRTFWKKAAFAPERLEKRAMSYGLAHTRIFECYLGLEQTKKLAATGELDLDSYPLNGYPSRMLAAEISAICRFAETKTMDGNDLAVQLDIAKKAGDFLISYSVPAGQPLEYMPRTYHERGSEYGRFKGEQDRIHLVYPALAGISLVALHKATGDGKYLEAAKRIARTYIRLQEKDGTWPMTLNAQTGRPYNGNRLVPLNVMLFMETLHDATGDSSFRECSDRAFAFVENGPLRNWNWEGQFEDGAKNKVTTHMNLSNFPANMTASYLVKRFPKDPARIAQAEELCRFVEDQFVDWEPPYDHGRSAVEHGREDDGSWDWFCRPTSKWCTPCVQEQYLCYAPVDESGAKTINTLLDVWEATGKDVYLQKAKALGDAQTRMVEPDGFINTWALKGVRRDDHRHHTWISCTMETMSVLGRLSMVERKK